MANPNKKNSESTQRKVSRPQSLRKGEDPSYSLSFVAQADAVSNSLSKATGFLSVGFGLTVLLFWLFFPHRSMRLMADAWVFLSLQEAVIFSFLGGALLYYQRFPLLWKGRIAMGAAGFGVAGYVLIRFLFFPSGTIAQSPFTSVGLFFLGVAVAMSPAALLRPRQWGDILGVSVLVLMVGFIYFFISYCHGIRVVFENGIPCFFCAETSVLLTGGIPCPRLMAVLGTLNLAIGVLATLGPRHFPMRSFVGRSARAALLRRFMPVTIAGILIFLTVQGSIPRFLSPSLTSFLTLCMSSVLVVYLVLRSSSVVSAQLETALTESEQRYSHLVMGLIDHAVVLLDSRGAILVWNPGAERITGYKAADVSMEPVSLLFSKKDPQFNFDQFIERVRADGTLQMEGWAVRKDGTAFWAETFLSKLVDNEGTMIGMSVIIRDVTERRKAEESVRASLKEKEVLLKEIHHRVKNNLQVISSLLRLQSESVKDKEMAALFLDSQERVRAMAMVHEFLYKSPDLARINFSAYVASLVRNLYRTFGLPSEENRPTISVDDVLLSLDVAVPCGLLLTELISNAIKYAYPEKTGGPVQVGFRKLADGFFELSVADQGVGFPENFDWMKAETLGLRLVSLLTEQLQGTIRLENHGGIKFVVTFKDRVV